MPSITNTTVNCGHIQIECARRPYFWTRIFGSLSMQVSTSSRDNWTSVFRSVFHRFTIVARLGKADYVPLFLSESARLYDDKVVPVDVALLNVSPPDEHGYCSLGVNVDMSSAGARNAKVLIGMASPCLAASNYSCFRIRQRIAAENVWRFCGAHFPLRLADNGHDSDFRAPKWRNVGRREEDWRVNCHSAD